MSVDRELLELAAKAAGIFLTPETLAAAFPKWEWDFEFEPYHLESGGMCGTVLVYNYDGALSGTTEKYWNPLTDDGDALRLAAELLIDIEWETEYIVFAGGNFAEDIRDHNNDRAAAIRRAVLRDAAYQGEQLP